MLKEIIASPEFVKARSLAASLSGVNDALVSVESRALLYCLLCATRPSFVVEIGSFKGGTTEVLALALDANGHGRIDTIGPFDREHFLPRFAEWPDSLRNRVKFYPVNSMAYWQTLTGDSERPKVVFVDGCHDYEFALFDIQSAAHRMMPGGFIVVDNVSQAGPHHAVIAFLRDNPLWTRCGVTEARAAPFVGFDRERSCIPGTDFLVMQAPDCYAIGERPCTFGERVVGMPIINGLDVALAAPSRGTLYAECVLRSFQNGPREEVVARGRLALGEGDGPRIRIAFDVAATVPVGREVYRAEPWLAWDGVAPLRMSGLPVPY